MSAFVDTSLFALNITTGWDSASPSTMHCCVVSRYREEIETHGHTGRRISARSRPPAAPRLFSGLTVAGAMAALGVMPQRFLYSVGVAGAVVGVLSRAMASSWYRPCWPMLASAHQLALDPTWPGRLGRLGPVAAPGPRSDAAPGHRGARHHRGLLLASPLPCSARPHRARARRRCHPGSSRTRSTRYLRTALRAGVTEGVRTVVSGELSDEQLAAIAEQRRLPLPTCTGRRAPHRAGPEVGVRHAGARRSGARRASRRTQSRRSEPVAPDDTTVLVSGNTARFIDEKTAWSPTHRSSIGLIVPAHRHPAVPAHRLGAAAAQDTADERPDARRHPRDPGDRVSSTSSSSERSTTPVRTPSRSPAWSSCSRSRSPSPRTTPSW